MPSESIQQAMELSVWSRGHNFDPALRRRVRKDSLQRAAHYRNLALMALDAGRIEEAKEAALTVLIFEREAEKHLSVLRAAPKETTSCQAK